CGWCSTPTQAGCQIVSSSKCSPADFFVPKSEVLEYSEFPIDETNQISLENINIQLRVNEPLSFNVSIKAAQDFPLDVYVLMDLSASFRTDLTTVQALAPQLPLTLRNVSSDFLIGFGTYVDKPTLPFTSNSQLNGYECSLPDCDTPFAYHHIVALTNSSDLFSSSVHDAIVSTNIDNPEGTLEAMLQAVVCDDIIGWRDNSRKILLVMTDDTMHTAGDGALAGITKPSDGLCHTEYDPILNRTVYTAALSQDYPSIGNISGLLDGFSLSLSEDSANLREVLQEAYSNVVSTAQLTFVLPDYISVKIKANCPPNSTYLPEKHKCSSIGSGTADFSISFTLNSCPEKFQNGKTETITVNVPGFDSFDVEIGGHCACECENAAVPSSPLCSNNGALSCGLCECNSGWSGPSCNCSTSAVCPLGPNNQECSGESRGQCVCGQCVCKQPTNRVPGVVTPRIEGDACECSNYECDDDSGFVCSGHGTCTCSNGTYACQCDISPVSGFYYSGDYCQCSYDNCIDIDLDSSTSVLCNGRGDCDPCQGSCECDADFIGQYCSLYTGNQLSCTANEECVKCFAKASKNDNTSCSDLSCLGYFTLSASQYTIPDTIDGSASDCSISTVECKYTYYVALSAVNSSMIIYQVEPEECLPIPIWAIAIIIVISILLTGALIVIVIKLIFVYKDHREYKNFLSEISRSKGSAQENPTYLKPIIETVNPAYGVARPT
uniref:Integrin beta n=1 Tax=Amphimedon queenslandica TaxID=400682 RepID=A0A1X7UZW0_AMPQE